MMAKISSILSMGTTITNKNMCQEAIYIQTEESRVILTVSATT